MFQLPKQASRLRFSLFGLLSVLTLVSCGLGIWCGPWPRNVAALFQVVGIEYEKFWQIQARQAALITSDSVLSEAIRDPRVARHSLLNKQNDPVDWLRHRLNVTFPNEIMEVSLRSNDRTATIDATLLNCVCDAYLDSTIFRERANTLAARDVLLRRLNQLDDEIEREYESLQDCVHDDPAADGPHIGAEIERLKRLHDSILFQIELTDVEYSGPRRVELIQQVQIR